MTFCETCKGPIEDHERKVVVQLGERSVSFHYKCHTEGMRKHECTRCHGTGVEPV